MRSFFAAFRLSDLLLLGFGIAVAIGMAGAPYPVHAALSAAAEIPDLVITEPPPCHDWDATISTVPPHIMVEVVPEDRLPAFVAMVETAVGHSLGNVSRAFAAFVPPLIVVGIEVDGCLLDPILLQPA